MDFWTGKLNAGFELTLEFNVMYNDRFYPSYISIDCPEQYVWGFKCDLVKWDKDSFNVSIPDFDSKFVGRKQHGDSMAVGKWIQGGMEFPLTMHRSFTGVEPDRPQSPPLEPDYLTSYINIIHPKDKVTLYGVLTQPKGMTPKACAIMVTGSGPQDYDETIMGHKPFWIIADYLTKNGYAVLRFDDRGSYRSTGNFKTATVFDFASDVNAALDFAKEMTGLDDAHLGLIGHSEGSMVSQIVLKTRSLGFFVSLAGPGAPVKDLMYQQNVDMRELFKISKDEFEVTAGPFLKKVLDISSDPKLDSTAAAKKILDLYKKNEKKFSDAAVARFNLADPSGVGDWLDKSLRVFLAYVPEDYLKGITIPMLALNGSKDKQVNSKMNLDIFRKYLKNNPKNEVVELENKNHMFQTTTNGAMSEYGRLTETFSPDALEVIKNWLNKVYP